MYKIITFTVIILVLCAGAAFAKKDQYIKDSEFTDTGFFSDYSGLMEGDEIEWIQVKEGVKLGNYKKAIILDFSDSSGNEETSQLRKEMSEVFSEMLMNIFSEVQYVQKQIHPKDYTKIRSFPANIVIMGNIKRLDKLDVGKRMTKKFQTGFGAGKAGMPTVHLELKMVDTKTGEEIVRIVHKESNLSGFKDASNDVINAIISFLRKS
jgi:hypothetical protein